MLKKLIAAVLAATMLFSVSFTVHAEDIAESQLLNTDSSKDGNEKSITNDSELKKLFVELVDSHKAYMYDEFIEYPLDKDDAFEYYCARYGYQLKEMIQKVNTRIALEDRQQLAENELLADEEPEYKSDNAVGATIDESVGASISYSVSGDTLTISGSGPMGAYNLLDYPKAPWNAYKDQITKIVISDGITTVGYASFYQFSKVTSVTMANTVREIRNYAFYGCSALKTISFSTQLYWIGSYSFYKCCALESVTIPSGVSNIEKGAFRYCYNLQSLTLPSKLTVIADSAFSDCSSLASVSIPSTVKTIGGWAFNSCEALKSVYFSEGLESIGTYAFQSCKTLTDFSLPNSLTELNKGAFALCKALSSITIPEKIKVISSSTFYACRGLKEVRFAGAVEVVETYAFEDCENLQSITLPDSVKRIERLAFANCEELTGAYLGSSLSAIGANPFSRCKKLITIFVGGNSKFKVIDGVLFDEKMETLVTYPCGRIVEQYTIPEGVKYIGDYAFASSWNSAIMIIRTRSGTTSTTQNNNDYTIKNLIMPDSVVSVGDKAFYNSRLQSVKLSNNLAEIGAGCFWDCDCSQYNLPDSLTRIGAYAFEFNDNLTAITIPKNVVDIDLAPFYSCDKLQSIYVASGNTKYKSIDGVLYTKDGKILCQYPNGKTNSVYNMPDTVQEMQADAVDDADYIQSVKFSNNLKKIDYGNFSSCSAIEALVFPDSLIEAEGVALLCNKLNSVTFGAGVKTIKNNSFSYCGKLSTIKFVGNLPEDCENLFYTTYEDSMEQQIKATVYYPQGDRTWAGIENKVKNKNLTFRTWDSSLHYRTDIAQATVSLSGSPYTYDGTAKKPKVTIKYNNKELLNGVDYEVTYKDNINAGKAVVKVTGIKDFYGNVEKTFTINKAEQTLSASLPVTSIQVGKTTQIKVEGIGTITYKSLNTSVATVSSSGVVTAQKSGSASIMVSASGNNNFQAASKSLSVTVTGTVKRVTLNDLSYCFENNHYHMGYMRKATNKDKYFFSYDSDTGSYYYDPNNGKYAMDENYKIPIDSHKIIFTDTQAKQLYAALGTWNGNCYGFSATAVMFNVADSTLKLNKFDKKPKTVSELYVKDTSSAYGMNVKTMLEAMLLSQFSTTATNFEKSVRNNIEALVKEVKKCDNGAPGVMVGMYRNDYGGHEVVAYKHETVNSSQQRIHIYDCNYAFEDKYITLYTNSSGKYTGWSYGSFGSQYSGFIDYEIYENVEKIWQNRRNNITPYFSTMQTTSDSFDLLCDTGEVVAEMRNGVLQSYRDEIYEVYGKDVEFESHHINIPTGYYSLHCYEDTYDNNLEIMVVNANQSASVKTQSNEVEFFVDDSQSTNLMNINGKSGESYEITINGDNDYTADNAEAVFSGKSNGEKITVGTVYGEYVNEGSVSSGIRVDGVALNLDNYASESISSYQVSLVNHDYDFTGDSIQPEVVVTDANGYVLSPNEDYIVVCDSSTYSGTSKATVYGIKDYKGHIDFEYNITNVNLNDCDIALAYDSCDHTDDKIEPKVTVSYAGTELKENQQYEVEYRNNTDPGMASAVIRGINGVNGEVTKTFEIVYTGSNIRGDVNGDGEVDIRDVTAIQRYVAETAYLTSVQLTLADVNNDGVVDINDATHLQMFLAEFDVALG